MASTALTTLQNTASTVQRASRNLSMAPSTPSNTKQQRVATGTPQSNSPGRWQHPSLAGLARRQKRNSFDSRNVWTILANVIALLVTWQWRDASSHLLPSLTSWPHWRIVEFGFTLLYATNIYRAALPAFRPVDNAPDVDLTAGQRALLGLDPNATPPETPNTRYITPPRYARSASSSVSLSSRGSAGSPSSISSLGGSFGSSRAASLGSAWSSPRSVSGGSVFTEAATGSPGGSGSGARGTSLLHRLHGRRRSSITGIGGAGAGRSSPLASKVPSYGDPDAWLDSVSGTPPRREEWRFMPSSNYGVDSLAAASAIPNTTSTAAAAATPAIRPALKQASSSKGAVPTASSLAPASTRSSPLGLSLDGTGLWNASAGSGKGSIFRPDTPSPIGTRKGAGGSGVSVPLTSRWLYERGREEGRF